jgi:hypothetical protein
MWLDQDLHLAHGCRAHQFDAPFRVRLSCDFLVRQNGAVAPVCYRQAGLLVEQDDPFIGPDVTDRQRERRNRAATTCHICAYPNQR